jgi:hypothetical protein
LKAAIVAGALGLMLVTSVQATVSYPVTVSVQCGSDRVDVVFTEPVLTQVEVLDASNNCLAKIDELEFTYQDDPLVNLRFSVEAGSGDTTFTINSSVVGFTPMTDPNAVASSSLTLTDVDGNGATLTGLEAGDKAYRAIYNGGASWAYLNPTYSVTEPFGGDVESNRQPISGLQPVVDTLTSIQSEYMFTLSANDLASGTSTFNLAAPVVPEPLSFVAVLTGLVGIGTYVRKRMRV